MAKPEQYTAVNITKDAKVHLERLQIMLSAQVGRRLSYAEAISVACLMLFPQEETEPALHIVH